MAALDCKMLDTKVSNRKKCIAEFDDLNHVFHPNFSAKYNSTLAENSNVFKTYKGVFTNMYDAANRNGNIIEVFTLVKKEDKKDNKNTNKSNSNNKSGLVNMRGSASNSNSNNFVNFSNQSVITHKGISSGTSNNKNNSDKVAKVLSQSYNKRGDAIKASRDSQKMKQQ